MSNNEKTGTIQLRTFLGPLTRLDRKSTRLNSSHRCISYAVFCLKKKNQRNICCELNINEGKATQHVKRALHQNASTYINEKITSTGVDRPSRFIAFGAHCYDRRF